MNEEHLDRYARLLVEHGAGLAAGQELYLRGEVAHRDLALRIAEAAYDRGAAAVHFRLKDPLILAQLARRGSREHIALYHDREDCWINDLVRRRIRFGNNNWTPSRARSDPKSVENIIHMTSEQIHDVCQRGIYGVGEDHAVEQLAQRIEIGVRFRGHCGQRV